MLYQRTLLIPANTPANTPVEATIVIKHPVISKISVHFPWGCADLASVAIFYGDLQLWPAKECEWVKGDDRTITDEPFFEMPEAETTLRLRGYSVDIVNQHSPVFYFVAIQREDVSPTREIVRVADLFEEFLTVIGAR